MGEKLDKTVKIAGGVGAVLTAAVTIIKVFSGR